MSPKEAYKLRSVRDIADELERLEDSLEELRRHTIGSPKLDGMPHSPSQGDAMASVMIRKEQLEERVGRASDRLRKAQNAARRVIAGMPAAKRLFFEAYYIERAKIEQACKAARISESTAYRYMRLTGEEK